MALGDRRRLRGGEAPVLLALTALMALTALTALGGSGAEAESALSECQSFHATDPAPLANVSFWTGSAGEDFAGFRTRSPAGWRLQNFVRFHELVPVYESGDWTVLCVGMVDTTTHTHAASVDDGYGAAWATLHTKRQAAAGLLRLRTRCRLEDK